MAGGWWPLRRCFLRCCSETNKPLHRLLVLFISTRRRTEERQGRDTGAGGAAGFLHANRRCSLAFTRVANRFFSAGLWPLRLHLKPFDFSWFIARLFGHAVIVYRWKYCAILFEIRVILPRRDRTFFPVAAILFAAVALLQRAIKKKKRKKKKFSFLKSKQKNWKIEKNRFCYWFGWWFLLWLILLIIRLFGPLVKVDGALLGNLRLPAPTPELDCRVQITM